MKRILAALAVVAALAIPVAAQASSAGPHHSHGQCASSSHGGCARTAQNGEQEDR
jgi:hypothetical protein